MSKKAIWMVMKILVMAAVMLGSMFYFGLLVGKNKDKAVQKYKTYFGLMSEWMDLMEDGIDFQEYLAKNAFSKVAIYGGRDAGRHLVKQLETGDSTVQYVIDRSVFSDTFGSIPVYRPDEGFPTVDAVIVTPVWDYQNIKEQLAGRVACPVISLADMIAEVKRV